MIKLTARHGYALTRLAEDLAERAEHLGEQGIQAHLKRGRAPLIGSGQANVVEIKIVYKSPSKEALAEIENIIHQAKLSADEIDISVENAK